MSAPTFIYPPASTGGTPVGGSGTPDTIPRWATGTTLGNSGLQDDGSVVSTTSRLLGFGIAAVSPYRARVYGNASGGNNFGLLVDAGASSSDFALRVRSFTGATEFLAARGDGNVGIGTASPGYKLDVNGQAYVYDSPGGRGLFIRGRNNPGSAGFLIFHTNGQADQAAIGGVSNALRFYTTSGGSLVESMRIATTSATPADSQVAIGTTSFTSGRALTTVRDIDVYGVRVGRGNNASATTNTAVGPSAMNTATTGDFNTAIGSNALFSLTQGQYNVGVGTNAAYAISTSSQNTAIGHGALYGTGSTGNANVAIGTNALNACTGSGNTAIGQSAGNSATSAVDNIIIGRNAQLAVATDDNQLVIGSSGAWVATNGAAATYYTTATALSTGTLPVTCGFIRVYLNGSWVKIPVYAD